MEARSLELEKYKYIKKLKQENRLKDGKWEPRSDPL